MNTTEPSGVTDAAESGAFVADFPSAPESPSRAKTPSDAGSDVDGEADDLLLAATGGDKPEPTFSLRDLKDFHQYFCEYEEHGGMNMATFVDKIGPYALKLHPGSTRKDVEILFKRIDANANGSVDWDEFATFLMMNDVKSSLRMTAEAKSRDFTAVPSFKGACLSQHPAMKLLVHNEPMSRLILHPRVGRYYTAGGDGMVKQWNAETLRHERTLQVSRSAITDMIVCPYYFDAVCALGMDKTVNFYSVDSGELMRVYAGGPPRSKRPIGSAGQDSDSDDNDDSYWKKGSAQVKRGRFALSVNREDADTIRYTSKAPLFGQVETCVPVLKHFNKPISYDAITMDAFGYFPRGVVANFPTAISTMKLLGDTAQQVMLIGFDNGYFQMYPLNSPVIPEAQSIASMGNYRFHWDAITKIIPVPELELLLTSSTDGMIQSRSLERLNDVHTLLGDGVISHASAKDVDVTQTDTSVRGHTHRVITMDWNYETRMIISCAPEKDALLWSPYIPKPIGKLDGQRGRLVDVQFIKSTRQALTLSDDRTLRIFDLRTLRVVQTLEDTASNKTAMLTARFDEKRDHIVLGSNLLRAWTTQRHQLYNCHYNGHRRPIVGLTVSRQFRQLITADNRMIIVWELEDGWIPSMRWEVDCGIVDICLDANGRRLFVATVEGTTHIYNYINGQLLKTCKPQQDLECTAVTFGIMLNPRVAPLAVSCHEDGVTSVFLDDEGGEAAPLREILSGEHATCVAVVAPSFLVIGDRGGLRSAALSETSLLATPLQRLPRRVTQLGCKSAIYPGPLIEEPIPSTMQFFKDRDVLLFNDGRSASVVETSDSEALDSRQTASLGVTEHVVVMRRADPQVIISATTDGLIQFWDVKAQAERFRFRSTVAVEAITSIALDQFQGHLAVGDHSGYVSLYNVKHVLLANTPGAGYRGENDPFEDTVFVTAEMISLVCRFRPHAECVSRVAFDDRIDLNEIYAKDVQQPKAAAKAKEREKLDEAVPVPPTRRRSAAEVFLEDEDVMMKTVNCLHRRHSTVGIMKHAPLRLFTASSDSLTYLWDVGTGRPAFVHCFGDSTYTYLAPSHALPALRVYDALRSEVVRAYVQDVQTTTLDRLKKVFALSMAEDDGAEAAAPPPNQPQTGDIRSIASFSATLSYADLGATERPLVKLVSFAQSSAPDAARVALIRRAFDPTTHDDGDIAACVARTVASMLKPPPSGEVMLGSLDDGTLYAISDRPAYGQSTSLFAAEGPALRSSHSASLADTIAGSPSNGSGSKQKSSSSAMSIAAHTQSPKDESDFGGIEKSKMRHSSSVMQNPDAIIEVVRTPRHGVSMTLGTCVDANGLPANRPSSPKTSLKGSAKLFTGATSVRPRQLEIDFSTAPPGEKALYEDKNFEKAEVARELELLHLPKAQSQVCDVVFRLKVPKKENAAANTYHHVKQSKDADLNGFSIFRYSEVLPSESDGMTESSLHIPPPSKTVRDMLAAGGHHSLLDLAVAEAVRQRELMLQDLPKEERASMLISPRSSSTTRESVVSVRSDEQREHLREQRLAARTPRPPPQRVKVGGPDESDVTQFLHSFKARAGNGRAMASSPKKTAEPASASLLEDAANAQPKRYQRQGGLLGELAWVARLHSRLEVPTPPKLQKPEALVAFAQSQQHLTNTDNVTWLRTLSHAHRARRDKKQRRSHNKESEGPMRRPVEEEDT